MVGVMTSKGCRMCVSRRIKCDEARPRCLRCVKKGCECPGYDRRFKFRDQTQALMQQYGREYTGRDNRASQQRPKQKQTNSSEPPRLIIDQISAPSLTYAALDIQTKESFNDFLGYYFPSYAAWSFQLEVNWMDFIRSQGLSCPQALIWAIRALNTFHMGVMRGNEGAIISGRHMYGRGIKHLAYLLQTPSALKDETLAAAILLGGYEMLDESCQNSWILHCGGIRHLMRARGPAAHKRGIGQTLMLSFRNFLVAEAFRQGESCFLGTPEWTSDLDQSGSIGSERGQYISVFQNMDSAFNETVKCPGYYAAIRAIIESEEGTELSKLDRLVGDMMGTKGRLIRLHSRISPDLEEVVAVPDSNIATTYVSRGCMAELKLDGTVEDGLKKFSAAMGIPNKITVSLRRGVGEWP
ncbi:Zn(II)2Cys6 transcription factor [Aspergillus alliaceus]|uniref:Zn(II)2Cys6 transcription factor n=1 Tax=Petromyces alliaceus TaxID=209559 RepID=UPI0012A66D42|nr:uncharacterized protein BDW43DRAFT_297069 [Aspergillus alliaceus]KAB8238128.1 hypothetical protein BDW43DRAFT_297069 [Aspergillus alliaceus]